MKTLSVFFVVSVGLACASIRLPTDLSQVGKTVGKVATNVIANSINNVVGIDIRDFAGIRSAFTQAGSEAAQQSILADLAAAFVAQFRDGVLLKDKTVEAIMTDYISNIKQVLSAPVDPSWQAGIDNEILGLNQQEFQGMLGTKPEARPQGSASTNIGSSRSKRQAAPKSVDWRTKGAVTPVKNQGKCGSCWAFGTIGAVEGRLGVKTGSAPVLSEQNLVDCAKKVNGTECCQGCDGGFMTDGYSYIQLNDGIDSEASYPYEAVDGQCRYAVSGKSGNTVGYAYIKENDEKDLMMKVAEGPVAVAVDANSWSSYKGGVFKCTNFLTKLVTPTKINHGVTVVGYGSDWLLGDFWIVKNSWGASWGENGYIRIARNSGNQCGIASRATYPLV